MSDGEKASKGPVTASSKAPASEAGAKYKDTLNLPKTDFPMKASLPQREPQMLARWEKLDIYSRLIEQNAGKELFVFHDGPPYANGHIHHGHVLNKTLKDIVVKYANMSGKLTDFIAYIPGEGEACMKCYTECAKEKELIP